ncbi:MAG: thiamine diphosphokinase, partial [Oscillospiraceae bacterium]|nr:thiamine diphosphokinase [Oscillospiraceae bacterium]
MKTCIIVGAGPLYGPVPAPAAGDFVIAADGGYSHLRRLGIRPDLVIGDFDSLPEKPEHPHRVELAREKDDTDMLQAVKYGLERGFRLFQLYGGTGGRVGPTLANLQRLGDSA